MSALRRTATLTALLLGAALLGPTGSASAAGETCRGEAATIVGTEGKLVGTEGRDVIVTGASFDVDAGAGNDVICVGGANRTSNSLAVDAGPGDDVVDSTAMPTDYYLSTELGDGADTYAGGPGGDSVLTGRTVGFGPDVVDTERDVVDTGAGNDSVLSGTDAAANADEVRLGTGGDGLSWRGTMQAGAVLDGGAEHDTLSLSGTGATYVLDISVGASSADGVRQTAFGGFEVYYVASAAGDRSVTVVGTTGRDDVTLDAEARLNVRLGDGDDVLRTSSPPLSDSTVNLGEGTDFLAVRSEFLPIALDLEDRTLNVDGNSAASVAGVENAFVVAPQVRLEGDRSANALTFRSCDARAEGGGGNDTIALTFDSIWETPLDCRRSKVQLLGGKGNDTVTGKLVPAKIVGGAGNDALTGSSKDDVILGGAGRDRMVANAGNDRVTGGAGRDKAAGSKGRDACAAEVERSCER